MRAARATQPRVTTTARAQPRTVSNWTAAADVAADDVLDEAPAPCSIAAKATSPFAPYEHT